MKKQLALFILLSLCITSTAQWCEMPDPNFCPGNIFQNGNFEILSGDPSLQSDQDISLATGWQAMWSGNSLADLSCGSQGHTSSMTAPIPNSGVYAGLWIRNSTATQPTYREGMYNRLLSPISQNSGIYSFKFDIANGFPTMASTPATGAIYGVYNPGNVVANAPALQYVPTNVNLWSTVDTSVKVVLLGTFTTPTTFTENWIPQSVSFNSATLPLNGITHIMITHDDNTTGGAAIFMNFDNFCLSEEDPESTPDITMADEMIKIFPNPSTEKIKIELVDLNPTKKVELSIYDIIGKKIFENKKVKNSIEINISNWAKGIYPLRLRIGNKNYASKIKVQ